MDISMNDNSTGSFLAVYYMWLSHVMTCWFSKYFQVLYIFTQIFKYFSLFSHFKHFFAPLLQNRSNNSKQQWQVKSQMANHKSSKGADKIVPTFFISDFSLPTHYRNHQYHNFNTPQNSQSSTSYLSPPTPPPMFGFFSANSPMYVSRTGRDKEERKKNKRKISRVELVVYHRVFVI